jgi:hypothetical protein
MPAVPVLGGDDELGSMLSYPVVIRADPPSLPADDPADRRELRRLVA